MSVQIGVSQTADIPALKRLWKQAFGDDDASIALFFGGLYTPDRVFALHEDGQLQAMACQLPMELRQGENRWRAAYLYAVATDADARGRGFSSNLLAYAQDVLRADGVELLTLVPGDASLRRFYEKLGYADFSTVNLSRQVCAPADGTAEKISPAVYLALRERLLQGRAYIACPEPVLSYQAAIANLYGGGLFRLTQGKHEGCACVARDGGGDAVIYELLGDLPEGASLAAQTVGAEHAMVRSPGDSAPFAMAKWLVAPPEISQPYLGIALD